MFLQNKPARQCLTDSARVVVQVREGPCLWWRSHIFADGYEHFVRQGQKVVVVWLLLFSEHMRTFDGSPADSESSDLICVSTRK